MEPAACSSFNHHILTLKPEVLEQASTLKYIQPDDTASESLTMGAEEIGSGFCQLTGRESEIAVT